MNGDRADAAQENPATPDVSDGGMAETDGPDGYTFRGGRAPRGSVELTREELRTTFDYQVGRLQEIDTKAIEILKANLLLIGILVTGGSILVQTDLDVAAFLNPFTVVGGVLLLASTGLAAVTYTASDVRGGLDAAATEAGIAARSRVAVSAGPLEGGGSDGNERSHAGFDERLLRSYAEWIEYNARVTAVNDLLATVTVVSVFVAFVYVVAGVAVGAAGLGAAGVWVTFLVCTIVMTTFSYVVVHMDHVDVATDRQPGAFEGVRISKGGNRRRATGSLRRMMDPRPSEEDRADVDGQD